MALAHLLMEYQDPQASSANPNGTAPGESCCAEVADNMSAKDGQCSIQATGGAKDNQQIVLPEQPNTVSGNAVTAVAKSEKLKVKVKEDVPEHPKLSSDKKRMRNISSKSKRLLMYNDEAIELKVTWEEAQDLLRPPTSGRPNIVMVEEFEFEEYSVS